MQKQHFPMVHTWGTVGAHFLRNYAPLNHLFINNLNQKGVEGHSFFVFMLNIAHYVKWLGLTPNSLVKQRVKYLGSLKPTR